MVEFKLNISNPKTGRTKQIVLSDEQSKALFNKKIGDVFKGETVDLTGYEFMISGGSDASGFPMRGDVSGVAKKKILTVGGVGVKKKRRGQRQRKTVAGNTVFEKTAQVNVKIVKVGKKDLFTEETPVEANGVEEAPKEEEKPEEKEEKPKEDDKEDSSEDKKE
ncbi:30S ribosomal protein S6e [Candidatus Woesearchaeota archaeon]|nr:30S ribosomal protein S6e [Candidatus Woesearchaeota archaeon]